MIGFALRWDGRQHGVLWITGDNVLYDGVRRVANRYGTGRRGGVSSRPPRTAIPVHYEGWTHFRHGREAIEHELARAPEDVRGRIRWLPLDVGVEIAA